MHDKVLTCLDLGHGCLVAIADRSDRQCELLLKVSLPIELGADLFRPALRERPRSTRIAQIGALKRDLQDEESVLGEGHGERLARRECGAELAQVGGLLGDVGGEDQRLEQVLNLSPFLFGEVIKDTCLAETRYGEPPVMTFEDRVILCAASRECISGAIKRVSLLPQNSN